MFQNQAPWILSLVFVFLQEHYKHAQHKLSINCSKVLAEFLKRQTCHCSYDMHVVTFYLDCLNLYDRERYYCAIKIMGITRPTSYPKRCEFYRVDNDMMDRQNVMTVVDLQLSMMFCAGTAIGTVNTTQQPQHSNHIYLCISSTFLPHMRNIKSLTKKPQLTFNGMAKV
jgi:hypothetical protein